MTKYRNLDRSDVFPASWTDALQEFIGTSAGNFRLELLNPTTLRVPAGTINDQVAIAIQGRWRYITTTITAAHPGGAATDYDVYVTGSDNSFSETPLPDTDNTVYAFGLQIRAVGDPPTTALYRKIATVTWSGSAITQIKPLLTDVGYVPAKSIDSSKLVDGTIPTAGIADGSVTLAKLAALVQERIFSPGDYKACGYNVVAGSEPSGWLLCDGREVSRSTYSVLYAALGGASSPHGQGNGTTTFNVPDFRGRNPIGIGQGAGLTLRTNGQKGGAETHTLLLSESPSHNHTGFTGTGTSGQDSPDHSHSGTTNQETTDHTHSGTTQPNAGTTAFCLNNFAGGGIQVGQTSGVFTGVSTFNHAHAFTTGGRSAAHTHAFATGGASARHTHTVPGLSITPSGGDGSHNNMPPWIATAWLVKT